MIEVVIDFDDLQKKNIYTSKDDAFEIDDIKHKMYLYFSEKLNLPLRTGPDAFRDFLWGTRYKWPDIKESEWGSYKEKDEWENYEEYMNFIDLDSQHGLKNEKGERDDVRIIFINYNKFKSKYSHLAYQIVDVIESTIKETAKHSTEDDGSDLVDMKVVIKS